MKITHCFTKTCSKKSKNTLQLPLLQPEDDNEEEKVESPPEYVYIYIYILIKINRQKM